MYRLIKKIVYLFTFYCCLDFLFFDFPVPAVSFPDAVVFFDVFLQFFPDFVNVSPKNHLQIMGRYVDVVS